MAANANASAILARDKERLTSSAPSSTWNANRLGSRLGIDAASAATAGILTCPVITVIDRYVDSIPNSQFPRRKTDQPSAIIEKAAKGFPIRNTLASCFRSMARHPAGFFLSTPFLLIYTLYTGTYLTANTIDTVSSTLRNQPFSTVFPDTAKFLATTSVNMGICVYKDARFARLFGKQSAPAGPVSGTTTGPAAGKTTASPSPSTCHPHPSATATVQVPKISYSLFCLRDSITIFASFNIPPLVAPSIPDFVASTPDMKAAIAQFACPALMQFVSTPMHLLGLDLYNRQPPGGLSFWDERWPRIRRDYVSSSFARMGKIVPAYGVGGVVNVRMRKRLMETLE